MDKKFQTNLLYVISVIIVITLAIQVYWNLKNYNANRISLLNQVQSALDNSVDSYYTDLAKSDLRIATEKKEAISKVPQEANMNGFVDSIVRSKIKQLGLKTADSTSIAIGNLPFTNIVKTTQVFRNDTLIDLKDFQGINTLATKIVISLTNEELDFGKLSGYLDDELHRRSFGFNYALSHSRKGTQTQNFHNPKAYRLIARSKSAFLPNDSSLEMHFPNIGMLALKESLVGIFLSFVLCSCIIASLLYLLRIINNQKNVALVKNDFISNISHELKTPITIAMSAVEAIQKFNEAGDNEKTGRYLAMSTEQLQKLDMMVERILETATLETDQLVLHKELVDIIGLVRGTVDKFQLHSQKKLAFTTDVGFLEIAVDSFHFENVMGNLIENAVKYGGDKIEVSITHNPYHIEISVSDNGRPIDKSQTEKIFEKFYRIPSRNVHDVKGFGIGLYYSRKIIRKHGGQLVIVPNSRITTFKITLSCL